MGPLNIFKMLCAGLCVLSACLTAWSAEAEKPEDKSTNMVANPGFEEVVLNKKATVEICHAKSPLRDKFPKNRKPTDMPQPVGWLFQDWTTTGPAQLSLDTETVAEGKQTLKIVMPEKGTGITLKQYVKGAQPETAYKLTFLARRSLKDQNLGMRIYCYPDSKHRNIDVRFFTEEKKDDFYEVSWIFPTFEKTDRILLLIGMKNGSKEPSTVWIDEVRLEKAKLED